MDGLELVSLIKDKPRIEKIPIVAMSIYAHLKFAALYGGCDEFLKKPVKMIDLMTHVRRFVHKMPVSKKEPAQLRARTG
jgi:response regulator RpfG family c-di-GMP phosphodiesterase